MQLKEKYTVEDLFEIMRILRGENGCPWDKVQTHETIKKNMIEECYEAIDALDSGDDAAFANELGDVFLQVVFHAVIAKERGAFDFDDILYELCTKLITRHTHVFGEDKAKSAAEALDYWEKSKSKEKKEKSAPLFDVPRGLPALMRAQKIQKKASSAGADFGSREDIISKISAGLELAKAANGTDAEGVIKEILFDVTALSRSLGVDAETALDSKTQTFMDNFDK